MPEGIWSEVAQNYALYITAGTAIISGLVVIYKKVLKRMFKVVVNFCSALEKIDTIFKEMTPNDGTSIKDKIDNIFTELTLAQQIQQAMAADTAAALFRTDSKGDCVWVNRTYARTVGRDLTEILGHGWQNVIAPEDREKVVTEWYESVEQNREFSMEFNFETPTGVKTAAKVRSYKLVDSKGEPIGYFGNCRIL